VAKILVADDNSNIQKMVGLALKDQGIDVVAVGNGEAAVRKIADIHPDLVLADVFMPVRNGYEVCRYVKEDPKFSHIPVILLVGAFDPLDEQEAQRSGADGVLKKPFVPPDPLISMVKSALARAGVAIGAAAHAEKPAEPVRPATEMLTPNPKAASPAAQKIVEPEPEPLDDFAAPPAHVKIAAGHEPVAFGSLLQTPDVEDDAAFMPKGREEIEERTWGTEETEEEEVAEEEESPRGGWRKEGHEDAAEETKETPDWREAAFHGTSPAGSLKSSRWTPAVEEPSLAETAHSPAVAVSTLEKPADALAPFSGDAWAAAMAAGVEEKLARAEEAVAERKEPEVVAAAQAVVEETAAQVPDPVRAEEPVKPAEPSNGWYSITSSPWDAEAKKASLLAATWDTPVEDPPAPAVIEQPAPVEPEPYVEEATAEVEEAAPAAEEEGHYAGSEHETVVGHHENFVAHESHTESSASAYIEAPIEVHSHHEVPAAEAEAEQPAEIWQSRESFHAEETPAAAETQEVEAAPVPTTESQGWENTWEAGALPAQKFAEVGHEAAAPVVEGSAPIDEEEHVAAAKTVEEPVSMFGQMAESVAAEEEKPDMDALVARVIDKMNPEVLKKMTHEFLRPVIAAIIQEELNSKKS
jgi:CheY-like chemotaxis protein